MPVQCLISLGSNVGDRRDAILSSAAILAADPRIEHLQLSRLHQTEPVGGPGGQDAFLNAAARLETSLSAEGLLALLHRVENELGRRRDERWGPRTLDLDLLLYGGEVRKSAELTVPHPRMAWRRFVLAPAAEVAAEMTHPTTGWAVADLLAHLDATPYYLALTGSIGAGKTALAERLVKLTGGSLIREPIDPQGLAEFYADPASRAWATELEFLAARRELLDRDRIEKWSANSTAPIPRPARRDSVEKARVGDGRRESTVRQGTLDPTPASDLLLSDFWFDQSAAFARVWLATEDYRRFAERFTAARQEVARPRLVVLLQAEPAELRRRVEERGRRCEQGLPTDVLGRIAEEIAQQTQRPDVGPVLRIDNGDLDHVAEEVHAAALAMR